MEIEEQALERLRKAVEDAAGRRMLTHADFEMLAERIYADTHQNISPTTLKRLWGYLTEKVAPRRSTLDLLAQFVGSNGWDDFAAPATPHRRHLKLPIVAAVIFSALVGIGLLTYHLNTKEHLILLRGQTFSSPDDYLRLFGIDASDTLWFQPIPGHENIIVWGPEYNHPQWHNYGNRDSLMPTISEFWGEENADSLMMVIHNRERYFAAQRLRDLRITFKHTICQVHNLNSAFKTEVPK